MGTMESLPFQTALVAVSTDGVFVIVQLSNNVLVRFDGGLNLRITVPSTYANSLTGMCGNYDGLCMTDLVTADGENVSQAWNSDDLIGNSYVDYTDPETTNNTYVFCSQTEVSLQSCNIYLHLRIVEQNSVPRTKCHTHIHIM